MKLHIFKIHCSFYSKDVFAPCNRWQSIFLFQNAKNTWKHWRIFFIVETIIDLKIEKLPLCNDARKFTVWFFFFFRQFIEFLNIRPTIFVIWIWYSKWNKRVVHEVSRIYYKREASIFKSIVNSVANKITHLLHSVKIFWKIFRSCFLFILEIISHK